MDVVSLRMKNDREIIVRRNGKVIVFQLMLDLGVIMLGKSPRIYPVMLFKSNPKESGHNFSLMKDKSKHRFVLVTFWFLSATE